MYRVKFVVLLTFFASSFAYSAGDVKAEIIARCKTEMGTYGAAMVKACVDQDIEALSALNKYPAKHKETISRCYSQMKVYGYAMVKACADQDIEAESALNKY